MTPEQKAYEAGYEAARKQAETFCSGLISGIADLSESTDHENRKFGLYCSSLAAEEAVKFIATMTPEKADD
jgi:hypothetical protein